LLWLLLFLLFFSGCLKKDICGPARKAPPHQSDTHNNSPGTE